MVSEEVSSDVDQDHEDEDEDMLVPRSLTNRKRRLVDTENDCESDSDFQIQRRKRRKLSDKESESESEMEQFSDEPPMRPSGNNFDLENMQNMPAISRIKCEDIPSKESMEWMGNKEMFQVQFQFEFEYVHYDRFCAQKAVENKVSNSRRWWYEKQDSKEQEEHEEYDQEEDDGDDGDEEAYEVKRIHSKKETFRECDDNKMVYYLVEWAGYSEMESSWEPKGNLKCPEILREFEANIEGEAIRACVECEVEGYRVLTVPCFKHHFDRKEFGQIFADYSRLVIRQYARIGLTKEDIDKDFNDAGLS